MCRKLQCFLLIILFYFFILLISSISWFFNLEISAAVLPLAASASCIVLLIYHKRASKDSIAKLIPGIIFFLFITGVSVVISILIFDNSFDGQTYHYEAQAAIAHRWNPLKEELTDGTANIFFINHYAKGFETGAAVFQMFFKNPESGKALNILLMTACFLYTSYLLQQMQIFKNRFFLYLVALIISLNPVAVYQVFTFYVDGQIALLFTILISSLYLFIKEKSSLHLIIAAIVFCIMADIKFTGLVYAILMFGFFGLWIILKKMNILRFFLATFSACIVTIFIAYNPYVTNTIQQSNPFYPLAGKNKIHLLASVEPAGFVNKNSIQKFTASNLSESHNIHGHAVTPDPKFKIPFSFSVNEWLVFKGSECRIAGYGPMFGGILLLSFALLLMALFIRRAGIIKQDAFFISILLLLSLVINPEMWMARYVPQLWLFPFCIIWLFSKLFYQRIFTRIPLFLFAVLTINAAGILIVNWAAAVLISYKMHKELTWLKALNKPVQIASNNFIAAKERMQLYGIKINEVSNDSSTVSLYGNEYKLQNSQAIIFLPQGIQKFENTGILKLLDKKLE